LAATTLIPSPAKPDINSRRESPSCKFCLINFFTASLQHVLVLVEAEAGRGLSEDRAERYLAHLQRLAAQVVAVQIDQIEGVQEDARVMAAIAERSKLGTPLSSQHTASFLALVRGLGRALQYQLRHTTR
jgi:hypothetical protein